MKGRDSSKWRTDISTSKAVMYKNLYNHIDLKVYGIEKQIEYDWMVKPGGNPGDIRFKYKDVKGTRLDEEGNLLIETEYGEWIHKRPVGYQRIGHQNNIPDNKRRRAVNVTFKKVAKDTYGFEVGDYDKRLELIIDPVVLTYSTYLGGEDMDMGLSIAVDSSGHVYMTGFTRSEDFPTEAPYQENLQKKGYSCDDFNADVFITKLSPTGNTLVYSTYLGGSGGEYAAGIAVDSKGHAYVTGSTESSDFPMENPFRENLETDRDGEGRDVFITKLSSSGSALVYSTYLGGSGIEYAAGIAVDSKGDAYVTGRTGSSDFPTENPFQENLQAPWGYGQDAFITKLSPSGSTLVYSTYLGGSGVDYAAGIAVDSNGHAFVTGRTGSSDFPTENPFRESLKTDRKGNGKDVFITKLSSSGSTLVYSTYLGGSNLDFAAGIAVDSKGHAYVTGSTTSRDFPTANPFQENIGDEGIANWGDAFITKLSPSGSTLVYSTYLGGDTRDNACGIAVDSTGNAYVTGITTSYNFPVKHAFQENLNLYPDCFVTKLSAPGGHLLYSTYLGGSGRDTAAAVAVDSKGNAYITGDTDSIDFPQKNPLQEEKLNFYYDVFAAKIGNFVLTLQLSRQEERAWLIRKQYAEILLTVDNPGDIPVSNYVIYRKESIVTDQYQAIKDIPAPEVQGGTYTCYDLLPRGDKAYTYKVEALDADGVVVGASDEQTI
jgi:hypothetical protein